MKSKLASALTVLITSCAALTSQRAAHAQTAPAEATEVGAEKKDTEAGAEKKDTEAGAEKNDPQAATGSEAGKKVPAAVMAMVNKRVVLRTSDETPVTGRLLAADESGFKIERDDRSVVVVPRSAARGIRLADAVSPPVAKPAAAPPVSSAPPASEPPDHNVMWETGSSSSNGTIKFGAALLGGAYGAAIGYAGATMAREKGRRAEGWWALFVPLAGPFIAIETVKSEGEGTALLVIDGSLQGLGLLIVALGAVTQGSDNQRPPQAASAFSVKPVFTGNGFGVAGTF